MKSTYALRCLSAVALWCAAASIVNAVTIQETELHDLFAQSDIVAHVQIRGGQLIEAEEKSCGVVYEAKIITAIKGQVGDGDTLRFGPIRGHELGTEYIVFLTTGGRRLSAIASYTSSMMRGAAEAAQRCASVYPGNFETLDGYGTLVIRRPWENSTGKSVVVFPEPTVIAPPSLARATVKSFEGFAYGTMLVPVSKVIEFLKAQNLPPSLP